MTWLFFCNKDEISNDGNNVEFKKPFKTSTNGDMGYKNVGIVEYGISV